MQAQRKRNQVALPALPASVAHGSTNPYLVVLGHLLSGTLSELQPVTQFASE